MSRIGKLPVNIPENVEVKFVEDSIVVKGPLGELKETILPGLKVENIENSIVVSKVNEIRKTRAFHGLMRSLIFNMVEGVTKGYELNLEMIGVGYKANLNGKTLVINPGLSHDVKFVAPEGIEFEVTENTKIKIKGISKQLVGQVAASIRSTRKPEPYKGKGIKYSDEVVRRKEGKKAK